MRPLLVLLCIAHATVAGAQERRWEIEGSVGVLVAQPSSAGTRTTLPAGPSIVTSLPTFPSRAVPSWSFGDGASLLNDALADFGLAGRLSPLDAMFSALAPARAAAFGVRVRRRLAPQTWLEVGVQTLDGSPVKGGSIASAVDATRDSYSTAFTELFASGPFARTAVSVQGAATGGSYSETFYSVAFNRDVGHLPGLQPYFTVGGGIVAATGTLPSVSLQGRYVTAILGEVPIDETDRVAVRLSRSTTYAVVAGGGARHDFSPAWCLRVDARVLAGPDTTRIRVDATPSYVRGTPGGFIESFTNPAIQFSNDPSTGRVSSLSGAALQDAEVFKGGIIARTQIAVTVARRF